MSKKSQQITDSFIQDEVIRAAMMMFSKRKRILMHWLNPEINKKQLNIDVNAAWDSLPSPEKLLYISQVLGKYVPHMSSLTMPVDVKDLKVDPQTVPVVPRVKRKFVKHKPFRKEYKKRVPKHKPTEKTKIETNIICEQPVQKPDEQELPYELSADLIDVVPGNFGLTDEEVDSILETIGDPSSVFDDLQI